MANLQISGLPLIPSISASDQVATDDATNTTYKFTLAQLQAWLQSFAYTPIHYQLIITTGFGALSPLTTYVVDTVAQANLVLPTTMAAGQQIQLIGYSGGWHLAQNAGQQIFFGDEITTPGTGGYIESTNAGDSFTMICLVANTSFLIFATQGNITVV